MQLQFDGPHLVRSAGWLQVVALVAATSGFVVRVPAEACLLVLCAQLRQLWHSGLLVLAVWQVCACLAPGVEACASCSGSMCPAS